MHKLAGRWAGWSVGIGRQLSDLRVRGDCFDNARGGVACYFACMYFVHSIHPFRGRGRGHPTHQLGFALEMRPNKATNGKYFSYPLTARFFFANACTLITRSCMMPPTTSGSIHPTGKGKKTATCTATSEQDLYELAVRPTEGSGIQCAGRLRWLWVEL